MVGERLRLARTSRGLTLHDVEAATEGEFKASAVGAYERGERTLSVTRLGRLATVYGVEPTTLLSPEETIDLPALHALEATAPSADAAFVLEVLSRFVTHVRSRRGIPSPAPLAVRMDDVALLEIILGQPGEVVETMLGHLGLRASHPAKRPDART